MVINKPITVIVDITRSADFIPLYYAVEKDEAK